MSAKERIATIRLLEHLAQHPSYAAALGVEGGLKKVVSADSAGKRK